MLGINYSKNCMITFFQHLEYLWQTLYKHNFIKYHFFFFTFSYIEDLTKADWIIIIFFTFFLLAVQLQLSTFSPLPHPTPDKPTSLPHLHPPPCFCPCVLYSSSRKPLSPLSPLHSPLAIVRLFLTSMSLVIFCLLFFFCWLCSS